MSTGLRPLDALLPRAATRFGAKAASLAALARAGFPVPAGFALSADLAEEVFARALAPELCPARLFTGTTPDAAELAAAREQVRRAELPKVLVGDLLRAFDGLCASAGGGVVVRSSALNEDLPSGSAAGLHASVLNVCSHDALLDAVRECWASLFDASVVSYLAAHASRRPVPAIGVLVQALVPAETAGVLFTVNPLTGDPDEMVVDAAFGLPTVVTDGRVTPDSYRVDKRSGRLRDRVIGDKRIRVVPLPGGGLDEQEVSAEQAGMQALDEHMLGRVVELGRRVERHFGGPRDVEFAIVGESLYVLQARPITALGPLRRGAVRARRRGGADPSETVWSNVNVGEALPGVATPLTWSVLSEFSEVGFRHAFAALGCTVPKDVALVGNFRGRIYLNLSELSRIGAQVPGLRPTAVLPLAGGAELERLEREMPQASALSWVVRLPGIARRYGATHLRHRRRLRGLEAEFREEHARLVGLDLRILPGPSLSETLADAQRLLAQIGATMLTTYGGLLSTQVVLRAALRVLVRGDAGRTEQRLLSAIEDVESAAPGHELLEVVAAFARDAPARDALMRHRARSVDDLPGGGARVAIERFLRAHGHRGAREAELSEPRWAEDPALLFDVLRLHLTAAPEAGATRHAMRLQSLRLQRDQALAGIPLAARPALRALVEVVRHHVRERERLRSAVVRVLGLLRRIALEASRRLRAREPEIGDDAAFLLTLDELHAALGGDLRTVGGLVRMRRTQLARDRALPDPPDTFVGYPPAREAPAPDDDRLVGLAASPGVCEGPARVLSATAELASLRREEILVAPFADVGWTPAFLGVAGLVTERGGPLSHACIIAREYGLPAVVNVRGATRAIRTGDRLRVDGDAGTVEILARACGEGGSSQ